MLPKPLKLEKTVLPTFVEGERTLHSLPARHPGLWALAQAMNREQFGKQLLGGLSQNT